MADQRIRENISLYRRGVAYAAKREGGHITGSYDVLNDETDNEGIRTIILKTQDKVKHLTIVKELAKLLAEKLGEGESKTFISLLEDTLIDYEEESILRMLDKAKKDIPVKTREGCFKIIIGDGRRKNADIIDLR